MWFTSIIEAIKQNPWWFGGVALGFAGIWVLSDILGQGNPVVIGLAIAFFVIGGGVPAYKYFKNKKK